MGFAAAVAVAAIMAGGAALMRPGQDSRAADDYLALLPAALDGFLQEMLAAGHRHRRQELAVGKLRQLFVRAADTREILDLRIVRFEVLRADRPIFFIPVAAGRLEVEIAQPIGLPAPGERAPANLPPAYPPEGLALGSGIGVVDVVDEEMRAVLIAGVTAGLNRLARRIITAGLE